MVCKPCAVPKCESKDGVRFRFPHPVNAKQRFEKWLEILKNPLLYSLDPMSVYSVKRICSQHFSPDCFFKPNKIKFSSVPTLNVPDPDAAKNWNYSSSTDYLVKNNKSYNVKKVKLINDGNNSDHSVNSEGDIKRLPKERIVINTVDNRCRVCLEIKENRLPLNYKTTIYNEESLTLMEIIHNFCNVEIVKDNKPQTICVECAEKLRSMYEITVLCEKNDFILNKEASKKVKNNRGSAIMRRDRLKSDSMVYKKIPPIKNSVQHIEAVLEKPVVLYSAESVNNQRRVDIVSKCAWCEINQFNRLRLKNSDRRHKTVVCLECYHYFKRQHRNKAINGVFIRKKQYICTCGARFGSSIKLLVHAGTH